MREILTLYCVFQTTKQYSSFDRTNVNNKSVSAQFKNILFPIIKLSKGVPLGNFNMRMKKHDKPTIAPSSLSLAHLD